MLTPPPEDGLELRIGAQDFQRLRDHLLRDPAREEIAFLLCGRQQAPDGRTALLVREVLEAPPEALDGQSLGHVTVSQDFGRRVLLRAREAGLDVLDAHSHPGAGRARFSAIDHDNEATMAGYVSRRIPGMWYGALVFTASDVQARLWRPGALGLAAGAVRAPGGGRGARHPDAAPASRGRRRTGRERTGLGA